MEGPEEGKEVREKRGGGIREREEAEMERREAEIEGKVGARFGWREEKRGKELGK